MHISRKLAIQAIWPIINCIFTRITIQVRRILNRSILHNPCIRSRISNPVTYVWIIPFLIFCDRISNHSLGSHRVTCKYYVLEIWEHINKVFCHQIKNPKRRNTMLHWRMMRGATQSPAWFFVCKPITLSTTSLDIILVQKRRRCKYGLIPGNFVLTTIPHQNIIVDVNVFPRVSRLPWQCDNHPVHFVLIVHIGMWNIKWLHNGLVVSRPFIRYVQIGI